MEAITRKLDTLTHSVNIIQTPAPICVGCGADHIIASYPMAFTHISQPIEINYTQNYRRQNGPYINNYHLSLNKHPNYTWVDNSDQINQMRSNSPVIHQQEENRQSLDDLIVKYITKTETTIQNQQATIHSLEN